jgi:hypothetical protein
MVHTFDIAGYMGSNVVPSSRRRPSRRAAHFNGGGLSVLYSADAIDPLQASGGFNSVIEFSALTCRQQVASALNPVALDRSVTAATLNDFLSAAAPTSTLAHAIQSLGWQASGDYRGFRLSITLGSLTFTSAQTALLSFVVTLSFSLSMSATWNWSPWLSEASDRLASLFEPSQTWVAWI